MIQIRKFKHSFWSFEIGVWSLSGICLPIGREFVIWDLKSISDSYRNEKT